MAERFEVEIKIPLTRKEGKRKVQKRLKAMGFVQLSEKTQFDYFLPGTIKGELLRVREEGNTYFQTHKERTWVDGTKVKRESEPEVHPISAHLILIGAKQVLQDRLPTMFKRRREFVGRFKGQEVTITIDKTPVLEDNFSGYWMEVEMMVDKPKQVPAAKKMVRALACKILKEKRKRTKKSYRRMLFKVLKKSGKFPKRWKRFTGGEDRMVCAPA